MLFQANKGHLKLFIATLFMVTSVASLIELPHIDIDDDG